MTYSYQFKIEGLPKTTNALGRAHWSIKAKEARIWKQAVWAATRNYRPDSPLKSASIQLLRYSSKRPDFDGLVSSFKHVLDGLIDAKIIYDDSPQYINVEYIWEKTGPKSGHISVKIEESDISNSIDT